jgi:hypothetical protein
MRKSIWALLALVLLGNGCAFHVPSVKLIGPTGDIVECQGFERITRGQDASATVLLRGCINDFQQQGYRRLPS